MSGTLWSGILSLELIKKISDEDFYQFFIGEALHHFAKNLTNNPNDFQYNEDLMEKLKSISEKYLLEETQLNEVLLKNERQQIIAEIEGQLDQDDETLEEPDWDAIERDALKSIERAD